MATVCPLQNEYGESLRWEFTHTLGTCIYNTYDCISFIMGWLSVLSWTFALLPQIITNCRNKAAESQSFWFWTLWLVGDVCNFSGCILTKNLITNIALALVYLTFTAFACLQFIWYEFLIKRYNFSKQKRLHLLISDEQQTLTHKKRASSAPDDDSTLYKTPSFAQKYHLSPKMTPSLRNTLKILSRSPRMFSMSTQLTPKMRREYEALQGMLPRLNISPKYLQFDPCIQRNVERKSNITLTMMICRLPILDNRMHREIQSKSTRTTMKI